MQWIKRQNTGFKNSITTGVEYYMFIQKQSVRWKIRFDSNIKHLLAVFDVYFEDDDTCKTSVKAV